MVTCNISLGACQTSINQNVQYVRSLLNFGSVGTFFKLGNPKFQITRISGLVAGGGLTCKIKFDLIYIS